jgi:outer membrane scaffolding protein for murein synthesis (MipA/OmpV family)
MSGLGLRALAWGGAVMVLTGAASARDWLSSEAFDVTAGAGVLMRPTYFGSDRYQAAPLPLVNVTWNDMLALGPDGMRLYWHHDRLTLGGGLTFDGGRDTKDHDGFSLKSGDDRLRGLGKIGTAAGYQIFASYRVWKFDLDAAAIKYDGDQNKGVVVRAGAALPLHLSERLVVTPHAGANWTNDRYSRTFFGVSESQALQSRFARFDAASGVASASAGLRLRYAIDRHWFVMGDVTDALLLGDAKKSPISFANSATTVATAIGYHF